MRYLKVAAVELNQTPLDWAGNEAHIRSALEAARGAGATVVCLPEMCITGYGCEDAFHSPDLTTRAWRTLQRLLPATKGLVVSLGLPIIHRNALFNAVAMIVDGRVIGLVAKRYLAGDGLHYEPRWFKPWPEDQRSTYAAPEGDVPLGDLFFDVGGVRIGFEICEDAWVAARPGAALAVKGVDIILNPSASHFAFGKIEIRKRFVLEGSRAFGASYVYANLLGNEAGRAIYDGGALIASGGRLVASGPRFSFADFKVTTATIDVDLTRLGQVRTASFRPDLRENGDCVEAPFSWPATPPEPPALHLAKWESGPHVKEEEFANAMSLALFDYLRKSRSSGFVVSLSGGADSTACAVLVRIMTELALKELGSETCLRKLRLSIEADSEVPAIMRCLLTTAYQATRNSGDVTRNAARTVADAVGADHFELDVDALVSGYATMVEKALGRPLSWERDDTALQNVQARARSPGIWMFANIRNALLLATSNRSEAAVGYATMDGDTSGGVSPIAGIDKNFLRAWLRWLETTGPDGLQPMPSLAVVNRQAPTAELRPAASNQTDEGDLMPYDFLDAVERAAIRDKRAPLEVFELLRPAFPQHSVANLALWIERFFRLWCRNQWKRERYAPSFHVDDENLDPKTWCRFPILSGGYETELAELRAHVATLDA